MELKLAEYKNGKFERLLELGKDFGYFGDYLLISVEKEKSLKISLDESCEESGCNCIASCFYLFQKDEKDPLNRFGGIFNNRSYGEGRFILVRGFDKNFEDEFYDDSFLCEEFRDNKVFLLKYGEFNRGNNNSTVGFYFNEFHTPIDGVLNLIPNMNKIGNLMQNPELWEKIK